mgnify:FL=1
MASSASNTSSQKDTAKVPTFIEPDIANGCETGACALAKCFYDNNWRVLRRLRYRRELSDYYQATFNWWAPQEVIDHPPLHRTFSQVLYALVNDGRVLQVSNSHLNWLNLNQNRQCGDTRHQGSLRQHTDLIGERMTEECTGWRHGWKGCGCVKCQERIDALETA